MFVSLSLIRYDSNNYISDVYQCFETKHTYFIKYFVLSNYNNISENEN